MTAVQADLLGGPAADEDERGGPAPRGRFGRGVRATRGPLRIVAVPVTVFLLASFATYGLGALGHANPAAAVLGDTATPGDIVRMDHQFGLDRPFLVQYVAWLGHALTGNLGQSYFTSIPVSTSVGQALPVDLSLDRKSVV